MPLSSVTSRKGVARIKWGWVGELVTLPHNALGKDGIFLARRFPWIQFYFMTSHHNIGQATALSYHDLKKMKKSFAEDKVRMKFDSYLKMEGT